METEETKYYVAKPWKGTTLHRGGWSNLLMALALGGSFLLCAFLWTI